MLQYEVMIVLDFLQVVHLAVIVELEEDVELGVVLPHHAADDVPLGVVGIAADREDTARPPFLMLWNTGSNEVGCLVGSSDCNSQGRICSWRRRNDTGGGLLVVGGTDGGRLVVVLAVVLVVVVECLVHFGLVF